MRYKREFTEHAAPEAIQARIALVQKRERSVQAELIWLRDLQAKRATQIMRGEWPPKKEGQ